MEEGRGRYKDCNGVSRRPVGYVPSLAISVGQCTLMVPCHVVENEHLGLLLGVPWLAGAAVELHFGFKSLTPHVNGQRMAHVPITFLQDKELVAASAMQFVDTGADSREDGSTSPNPAGARVSPTDF